MDVRSTSLIKKNTLKCVETKSCVKLLEAIRECNQTSLRADSRYCFTYQLSLTQIYNEPIRCHNVKLETCFPNLDSFQTRRAAATKVSVWSARGITLGVINHNSGGVHQACSGGEILYTFP